MAGLACQISLKFAKSPHLNYLHKVAYNAFFLSPLNILLLFAAETSFCIINIL